MILTLFITFLTLGLALVVLGYASKEGSYSLIGWTFIFLLAVTILLTGNLEYKTGNTEFTHYEYTNETAGNPAMEPNNYLHNTTATSTDTYTSYTGDGARWFGVWLAMASIAGFIAALNELQPFWRRGEYD